MRLTTCCLLICVASLLLAATLTADAKNEQKRFSLRLTKSSAATSGHRKLRKMDGDKQRSARIKFIVSCCGKMSCLDSSRRRKAQNGSSDVERSDKVSTLQDVSALKTSLAPTTTQIKSTSVVEDSPVPLTDKPEIIQVTEITTRSVIETEPPQTEPPRTEPTTLISTSTQIEPISSTQTSTTFVPTTSVAADTTTTTQKVETGSTTTKAATPETTLTSTTTKANDIPASLFLGNSQLDDPRKYGFWLESCGKLYLLGKSVVDWQANAKRCCAIGMTPIQIDSLDTFSCLNLQAHNWTYNSNYWTGGKKVSLDNKFQWCSSNQSLYKNASYWAYGRPSNTIEDRCVHLKVNKGRSAMEISDRECTDKYVLGCQGTPTPAPACQAPSCLEMNCNHNMSYYNTYQDGSASFLKEPSSHGTWHTVTGRAYVFSYESTTWKGALEGCCAIGMKLLSVDYDHEYSNLLSAINGLSKYNNKSADPGDFWTSGTDSGCDSAHGWCAVNKLFRQAKWAQGQPDNKGGNEHCVSIEITKATALLQDQNCDKKLRYVCESRDTTNTSSNSEAMVDECGAAYNVTRVEAETIFNLNVTFPLKIKCFLKCIGEQSGFIVNGRVVDEKLLAMAELLSYGDSPAILQSNLLAVDICSTLKGMDECDTASMVFRCGQENAPELVADIINQVELNSSAESVPLKGDSHKCFTDYSCMIDPVRRGEYKTATTTSLGTFITACGIKYFASSQLYTYPDAASICCQYGLHLVSFETPAEVTCIISKLPSQLSAKEFYTSASRRNKGNYGYGWCTSSAFLDINQYNLQVSSSRWMDMNAFLLSIQLNADFNSSIVAPQEAVTKRQALCEP